MMARGRKRAGKKEPPRRNVKQQKEDGVFQAHSEDEILSSNDEDEDDVAQELGDEEEEEETADEKRLRLAKSYLEKIRAITRQENDDDKGAEEEGDDDSMVASLLQKQQLEESGRVQRLLGARIVKALDPTEGRRVGRRHRQSVTCVAVTGDDSRGFAASKDGLIVHWDIESGQSEKYEWPSQEASVSGNVGSQTQRKGRVKHESKHVITLAVSSDGRYLATGGFDQKIHLWDTRTREHIQAFPGHRGAVSSLAFRYGTQQLMSASFDRTIKLWNVEDRLYIDTLYGHQSEVLTIDCLRQERVLSAGRDHTLRIWKIPDETQLVFRGHLASIECCCFINNSEFLSGSDDGCVALWSTMRKKPVFLLRNAHGAKKDDVALGDKSNLASGNIDFPNSANGNVEGQQLDNGVSAHASRYGIGVGGSAESWVGAVAVCRGSDIVVSGAGDGWVRLWALEEGNRSLRAICGFPVNGFVNSLAFAKSCRFLLAGVGQEPRLGRWGLNPHARNGVVMHTIDLSDS